MIASDHGTIRRDRRHLETIELPKLARLCARRSRHPTHDGIERDQILHRDRPEHPALPVTRHLLFQLERRLQSRRPATVAHHASLELVDRQDRRVLHQVVDVAVQQRVRVQRILNGGHGGEMSRRRRDCCTAAAARLRPRHAA